MRRPGARWPARPRPGRHPRSRSSDRLGEELDAEVGAARARRRARPACSSMSARSASSTATSSAWRRKVDGLRLAIRALRAVAPRHGARSAPGRASASASPPSLRCPVRREVVRRERARQLVVAERLEVARRGEVARPAVALRQRVVGDLADERLDERVLAALGRARVDLDAAGARAGRARAAAARASSRVDAGDRGEAAGVKVWPRTAASWSSARSAGVERVEPGRDERSAASPGRRARRGRPTGS